MIIHGGWRYISDYLQMKKHKAAIQAASSNSKID
jgi:hypothetical protein